MNASERATRVLRRAERKLTPDRASATAATRADRLGAAALSVEELARRAVLATLQDGDTIDAQIEVCLAELQSQRAPILRRSLAAEPPPDDPTFPGDVDAGGWAPFGPS